MLTIRINDNNDSGIMINKIGSYLIDNHIVHTCTNKKIV